MEEETIIKRRLLLDERGLRKVVKRWMLLDFTFQQHLRKEKTSDKWVDIAKQFQYLMIELSQYEMSMKKYHHAQAIHDSEASMYYEECHFIEQQIQAIKSSIQDLKSQLKTERELCHYKQEYDLLAKVILEHSSPSHLLMEIDQVQKEIMQLDEETNLLRSVIDQHSNQYQYLFETFQNVHKACNQTLTLLYPSSQQHQHQHALDPVSPKEHHFSASPSSPSSSSRSSSTPPSPLPSSHAILSYEVEMEAPRIAITEPPLKGDHDLEEGALD